MASWHPGCGLTLHAASPFNGNHTQMRRKVQGAELVWSSVYLERVKGTRGFQEPHRPQNRLADARLALMQSMYASVSDASALASATESGLVRFDPSPAVLSPQPFHFASFKMGVGGVVTVAMPFLLKRGSFGLVSSAALSYWARTAHGIAFF